MSADDVIPESFAKRILQQAIDEGRAAEFLNAMWDGGSATIDLNTGKLVIVSGDQLMGLGSEDDPQDHAFFHKGGSNQMNPKGTADAPA